MKKYLIVFILGLFIVSCSPHMQISRDIEQGELGEAKNQLDELQEEEDAGEDPDLLLLKADFNMAVYQSEVPEHQELIDEPLSKAHDYIYTAEEVSDDVMQVIEIEEKKLMLSQLIFDYGLQYYENQHFAEASENFYKAYKISEDFEDVDTMTLFNAAMAAEQGGMTERAQEHYTKLVEMELDEPYIYTGLSNTYLQQIDEISFDVEKYEAFVDAYNKKGRIDSIYNAIEDEREIRSSISYELDIPRDIAEIIMEEEPHKYDEDKIERTRNKYNELFEKKESYEDEALTGIKKGREKYPDNIDLIFGEANFYLLTGRTAEAREILDLAIEKDPENPSLHFAFGANYEEMAQDELLEEEEREEALEEAIKAYERAIELDDEYVDAYYNLGVLYFNKGIRIFEEAEEVLRETRDFEQYREAEEEIEEYWLEAQPYLERAKELISKDHRRFRPVVTSLFQLYARTGQNEKQQELQEEYPEIFEERSPQQDPDF